LAAAFVRTVGGIKKNDNINIFDIVNIYYKTRKKHLYHILTKINYYVKLYEVGFI